MEGDRIAVSGRSKDASMGEVVKQHRMPEKR
jgi:hypothetical protein